MPFISIRSLPFSEPRDVPAILAALCCDFAEKSGLPPAHIHATWEFFAEGHYAKGGNAPALQPDMHHPVLVDLLTPDYTDRPTVAQMLTVVAESLSVHARISIANIFILHRAGFSGRVFDDGKVAHW